ncbi:MAG: hypothetical protein WCI30_06010 [Clostridia bacterium]
MKTKTITQGALVVALIMVFFLIFKGVTNIFNALLVPLSLYLVAIGKAKRDIFSIYLFFLVMCAIFFSIQIIFAIFYCGIAFLLAQLLAKKTYPLLAVISLAITTTISFGLAISLTDFFFLTEMSKIILRVINNNMITYSLLLLAEGSLVASLLYLTAKIARKRLYRV